jgi:hypothetical protein
MDEAGTRSAGPTTQEAGLRPSTTDPATSHRWRRWIVMLLVGSILGFVYFDGLEQVSYHRDEAARIRSSNVFDALLSGDRTSPVWGDSYYNRTQPQISRYLIGLGRWLGGFEYQDLPTPQEVASSGRHMTTIPGLVWWCRFPNTVLAVLTGCMLTGLLWTAAGGPAAILFATAYAVDGYFLLHLRQALGESALLFFWAAAMTSACMAWNLAANRSGVRRDAQSFGEAFYLLLAASCVALSASAKLNGFAALPALFAVIWLIQRSRRPVIAALRRTIVASLVVGGWSLFVFIAANPHLHSAPWSRISLMWEHRVTEMRLQSAREPESAVQPGERPVALLRAVFERESLPPGTLTLLSGAGLSLAGLLVLAAKAMRRVPSPPGRAAMVILLFGVAAVLPVVFTPLTWPRYFLFPVTLACMASAAALGAALSRAMVQFRSIGK